MANKSRFLLDVPMTAPGEYELNSHESHHAVNVMRHKTGEAVIVFDGKGNYAEALMTVADKNRVKVVVNEVLAESSIPLFLTLATAIPKGKRWQLLVEKCTELGVDRIVPVLSERSVAKGEGDLDKWRRWIVEAAKQSRRARIPEILNPVPLSEAVSAVRGEQALLLMADARGAAPHHFRASLQQAGRVVALIGPEGGFSQTEMDDCRKHGAQEICLSPFVLRIETAAAVVCAFIREIIL